jgi:hypothetical protein
MLARVVSNGCHDMTPGLVDRIVDVVRPAVALEQFTSIDGKVCARFTGRHDDAWVVRSANPLPWATTDGRIDSGIAFFAERIIGDEHLRPIGGVPVDEETRDEVPA